MPDAPPMNSSKRTATTFAHIHAACQHKASETSEPQVWRRGGEVHAQVTAPHTRTRTRKRSFFEMHMWSFHPLVYLFSLEIDSEARELDHPLLDPRQGEPRVALQDLTQELSDDVI